MAAIYKGAIKLKRLRADVALLELDEKTARTAAVPFPGEGHGVRHAGEVGVPGERRIGIQALTDAVQQSIPRQHGIRAGELVADEIGIPELVAGKVAVRSRQRAQISREPPGAANAVAEPLPLPFVSICSREICARLARKERRD